MGKSFVTGRFSKFGFKTEDIPKAIIIHELLGISMLILTWSACYHLQFSKNPFVLQKFNQFTNLLPKSLTSSLSNAKLPFGIDKEVLTSRMGSSYIEASCFRKIIRPLTLPAKLVVTYKLVTFSDKTKNKINPNTIMTDPAFLQTVNKKVEHINM